MTRIEKILIRVRDTLADPKGERWSDERLLRLLDEAQKDLCRRAKLLRSKTSFIVFDGQEYYKMPEDFMLLDKVYINEEPIPLVGHTDLDNKYSKWDSMRGVVSGVVYDKQMRGNIRLFPIPDYSNGDRFKVVPSYNSYYYGKVKGSYGVIANISEAGQFTNGVYGVTSEVTGIFQWQETPTDMPKVIVKEYKMESKFGFVNSIVLDYTPEYSVSPEYGTISFVEGMDIDVYGIVTGVDGVDGYNVNFTDTTGEGVSFNIFETPGYFSVFPRRGMIVDICNSVFLENTGVITQIELPDEKDVVFSSPYGLAYSATIVKNIMEVLYIRKPKDIINLESELDIDDCFDSALKYYVAGKAFRDDIDAQNRSLGAEELQLYERELQIALSDDMLDFTRNNSVQYETTYGGIWQ